MPPSTPKISPGAGQGRGDRKLRFQSEWGRGVTVAGIFRKDILRKGLLGLVAVAAAIQLVPVDRTSAPVTAEIQAPANVRAVLKRSCYDCHSNETTWPWYSRVAPVSWLVARDVREGRKELNFSEFAGYAARRQAHKLKEVREQVADGEMPPWFYVAVHSDAALSPEDKALLREWSLTGPQEPERSGGR
jgi:hypothetical protein